MHTIILILVIFFNVILITLHWYSAMMNGQTALFLAHTIQFFTLVYLLYQIF